MPTSEYTGPEEFRIGPDRVVCLEDAVLVYTPREMTDWQLREFCRIPIYFRSAKYYLLRKARGEPPFAFCYELAPWPANLFDESKQAIQYDEAYVARREGGEKAEEIDELGRCVLLPLYPFLGFLWSGFKDRKLERFGFNPVSLTGASLYLALVVFLGETIFFPFLGRGFLEVTFGSPTPLIDYFLFVVLPLDTVARYSQVLRGVEAPDGFLEWLIRWLRRVTGLKKRRSGSL
jgi:hypothetical protein